MKCSEASLVTREGTRTRSLEIPKYITGEKKTREKREKKRENSEKEKKTSKRDNGTLRQTCSTVLTSPRYTCIIPLLSYILFFVHSYARFEAAVYLEFEYTVNYWHSQDIFLEHLRRTPVFFHFISYIFFLLLSIFLKNRAVLSRSSGRFEL